MNKRLFISKNDSEVEPYRYQFEELGFIVEAHSFLSFSPVEFEVRQEFDVLFFGSPRAVIFYLANESISGNKLIACVGGKTAELLKSLNHEVAFVGAKSGEPKVVAEDFNVWLGSRTSAPLRQAQRSALIPRVLFPVSDRSLKTIAGSIPENQKEEVVVYSTEVKGKLVGVSDVYVFTSPSNVEGFFIDNVIPEKAEVVAWGKSTEEALVLKGIDVKSCLKDSSFGMLLECLGLI